MANGVPRGMGYDQLQTAPRGNPGVSSNSNIVPQQRRAPRCANQVYTLEEYGNLEALLGEHRSRGPHLLGAANSLTVFAQHYKWNRAEEGYKFDEDMLQGPHREVSCFN